MIEFEPLLSLEEEPPKSYGRGYLGLSGIGQECDRKILLGWLWATKTSHPARVHRIFDAGHSAEEYLNDLIIDKTECGLSYYGSNQLELIGQDGHWVGHPDGILEVDKTTYLLEVKTHNDSNFNKLLKDGVKSGHPAHYDQMQAYMSFDFIPSQGVYLALNKNTSELYTEVIEYDSNRIELLLERQRHLLDVVQLPERIGNNKITYFKCKMCEYAKVCFEKDPIEKNCRTCKYCAILPEGKFGCAGDNSILPKSRQITGCDAYELDEDYFKL